MAIMYETPIVPFANNFDEWASQAITLNVDDTEYTFDDLDPTYAYNVFFEVAVGQAIPNVSKIETDTGTTSGLQKLKVTFSKITEDQAGGASGTSCKIKLRKIK